ncbi:MAG: hypothetical protein HC837_15560 [Chloroflexaceae bacterium]|nr:hypothetical protein [Chloroflexaceae bacterium]
MDSILIVGDMAMVMLAALIGGTIAARLGLPALIGYLLAGILVGPFTPGPVLGDLDNIHLFAEIGVILLMFGVGVDFSIDQLRRVRNVALFGGGAQVLLTIGLGLVVGTLLAWPWGWSLFFGCIMAISSTTVMLKLLMDRGEMGSEHGQMMLGVSLIQDLSTILMVALLPALTTIQADSNPAMEIGFSLLKTALFLGLMFVLGTRLFPFLLKRIAQYGSRELFLLATVGLSIGTAFVATEFFGLSLALGAFIGGLVVSESELHHRILGEVLPIRDIFGVLFFVSVGLLINPGLLPTTSGLCCLSALSSCWAKFLVAAWGALALCLLRRTILLVAAGLAQIGEFSFILAQQGRQVGVLDEYITGLTLSGALISTVVSPFLLRGAGALGAWADARLAPSGSRKAIVCLEAPAGISDHVVVCGYGRIGRHIAEALAELGHPYLVIEQDWLHAEHARQQGAPVIYGDASNAVILAGARLERARVAVVTAPDPGLQRLITQQIRNQCPEVPIIVRSNRVEHLPLLYKDGANDVIVPTFEGGLEMLRQTLTRLGVTVEAIQTYTDAVHCERYAPWRAPTTDGELLSCLRSAHAGLNLEWYLLQAESEYVGQSIGSLEIRRHSGASIVAIVRDGNTLINPPASTTLRAWDRIAVIGNSEQRHQFVSWLRDGEHDTIRAEDVQLSHLSASSGNGRKRPDHTADRNG